MIFSLNSLNNFIDLQDFFNQQDKLADKLSCCGFEVERWEKKEWPHLVVVEIQSKKAHPSADRLSLCQVEGRGDHRHSIVCGATNFQEGDKAVLALPGAVLPDSVKIKTRKVRGELSEGMLVSLGELGLAGSEEEQEGILILPKEAEVGSDFASCVGLNDTVFDIDITPNRADCLSHFGMARELSCILNQKLKISLFGENQPSETQGKQAAAEHQGGDLFSASFSMEWWDGLWNKPFTAVCKGPSIREHLGLEINSAEHCTRYTGRAVYGVKVGPSPLWLRVCLENLGFKPINNIVDITNYFLVQWGQPLHAFDLDFLQEKIIVDFSQKNEKFQTLDKKEIQLTGKELCIRDVKQTLALAGVIGGLDSGIHSGTANIFLESACFEPSQVRRSAKRFHIDTDSSYRFSRGVPSEMALEILRKAVVSIQSLAGGEISKDEYDFYPRRKLSGTRSREEKTYAKQNYTALQPKCIEIQKQDIERRLGMELSFAKFQNWMERLHCGIQTVKGEIEQKGLGQIEKTREIVRVFPPFFRTDLNIKEDLIEEYARLEGYDKIPEKVSYLSEFPRPDQEEYILFSRITGILAQEGFYQAINHSFISQKFSDSFLGLTDYSDKQEEKENADTEKERALSSFVVDEDESIKRVAESSFFDLPPSRRVWLQNPMSAEYNMMRVSLAPSLFKNAQQSIRHGCLKGRLFELGEVFSVSEQGFHESRNSLLGDKHSLRQDGALKENNVSVESYSLKNQRIKTPYREDARLALMAWGQEENLWEKHKDRLCVYDLKTALNALLEYFCIVDYEWVSGRKAPVFIHPFQYMVLRVRGESVAYIGSLSPIYAEDYKIRVDMALAEMNMDFLTEQNLTKRVFKTLSPFPVVERDLSFLVPKELPARDIIKGIKRLAGPICRSVKVFDVYENESIRKEGVRALSLRLTLQSDKKTLTEDHLKNLQDRLTKEMLLQYPVKLR